MAEVEGLVHLTHGSYAVFNAEEIFFVLVTGSMPGPRKKPGELSLQRRRRPPRCSDRLVIAPLWVSYTANLGTLLRTCDAVGACIAVPATRHYRQALQTGDTLERRPCVHWVPEKLGWIEAQRVKGSSIVGVELADDAIPLYMVTPASDPTVLLLGHEHSGLPDQIWPLLDVVIEIPMVGTGSSLNVAVAGSLVLYKLAGLS